MILLKSAIVLKGTNFVKIPHGDSFLERLNFYGGKVQGSMISLELLEIDIKKNNETKVCMVHLTKENVYGLRDWIDEFLILSEEELENKFKNI